MKDDAGQKLLMDLGLKFGTAKGICREVSHWDVARRKNNLITLAQARRPLAVAQTNVDLVEPLHDDQFDDLDDDVDHNDLKYYEDEIRQSQIETQDSKA